MAQASVGQAQGHDYTTSATTLKYRTKNSGNPLNHDDVDANFDILRKAVNGLVTDVAGVAGKTVNTNVPVNAVFTDTTYTAGTGLSLTGTVFSNSAPDRTVTLSGSGATTVTGTYPTFTISSTDNNTITKVGVTNDLSSGNITLTGGGATSVSKSGNTITVSSTDTNTTYSNATSSTSGLMSSTDKAKLDGLSSSTYNSGWWADPFFTTGHGGLIAYATYTFSHNFGHTNFMVQVWVARTAAGLSATLMSPDVDGGVGYLLTEVTNTNLTIQLAGGGYPTYTIDPPQDNAWGSTYNGFYKRGFGTGNNTGHPNWAYLKVIATAI